MQHFFNNVPIAKLNAGRSIYCPGELRKVSTPICTYIRYIYIQLRSKQPQIPKPVNRYPTIKGLQDDQGVNIHCLSEDYVTVYAGIIACDSELVNAGDIITTICCQVNV